MTTSPATGARRGGDGAHRRRWWILVAVVAAVAAIPVVVLVLRDDETPTPDGAGRALRLPPASPAVDAEGRELLDLLAAGRRLTIHARYVATGAPAVIGTQLTIDLWRREGLARQDTRSATETGTAETAVFLLGDDHVISCSRVDQTPWTCTTQTAGGFTADGLFDTVAEQLQGTDVTATDEEVAGQPARCFVVPVTDGGVSLCVSTDGVPLRLKGNGTELRLSDRSEDVPPNTYTPPAKPVPAG